MKITAEWNMELWVTCPHCAEYFDLIRTNQWGEHLFECFEPFERKDNVDVEVKCEKCKKNFIINNTAY